LGSKVQRSDKLSLFQILAIIFNLKHLSMMLFMRKGLALVGILINRLKEMGSICSHPALANIKA